MASTHRRFILGASLLVALGILACGSAGDGDRAEASSSEEALRAGAPGGRPNFVLVLTDDLDERTFDAALANNLLPNIKTHVLDRGVRFTDSFVTDSICCPSRATCLTGQYPHNHGVLSVVKTRASAGTAEVHGIKYWLDKASDPSKGENNTLPVWLRRAGYRTGLVGKYLNGYGQDTGTSYVPVGYDEWHGLIDPTTYAMYGYSINDNGRVTTYGSAPADYQTDVLAGRAEGFIRASVNAPFFLWVTPPVPHIEKDYEHSEIAGAQKFQDSIRPPPRYNNLRDGLIANGELPPPAIKPSAFEADLSEKHPKIRAMSALTAGDVTAIQAQFKDRMAALKGVDDMVGRIVATLQATGQYGNTVLVFSSDNGWFYGEHRLSGKQWAYEESIRVPLVVASPFHGGRGVSQRIVVNNDLAPTIADLAGVRPGLDPDGRSFAPLLANPNSPAWTRKRFFVEYFAAGDAQSPVGPPTFGAVREKSAAQNMLYVRYFDRAESISGNTTFRELYDVNWNPSEEVGVNGVNAFFEPLVPALATCAGAGCRALEDG